MPAAGLIIGAPRSGVGKTTITLALLAAFRRRGVVVRAAKSGPDYIDPGFHAVATRAACPNLDSWAMAPAQLDAVVADLACNAELVLIEGAMGLFDGVDEDTGRSGATADLAVRYDLPVVLVLDVTGQSQSAAALVRGFLQHDPRVRIGGVVLNRVGSDRHRDGIVRALERLGVSVLGSLPRSISIALPERHLGLVQAEEHQNLDDVLEHLATLAEQHLDLDRIVELATPLAADVEPATMLRPPGQKIALAQDAAFSFVYPHLLSCWRSAGAEIITFSPLADDALPDCDAYWLPGGYPELHAAQLAAANRFRAGLIRFAESRLVHGECGGYMVLGKYLEDASGERHAMLGLLDHATSFAKRHLNLGYRQVKLLADGVLGPRGTVVRGHEFHYARLIDPGSDAPLGELYDASGRLLGEAGGRRNRVSGSFFHVVATEPPGDCR